MWEVQNERDRFRMVAEMRIPSASCDSPELRTSNGDSRSNDRLRATRILPSGRSHRATVKWESLAWSPRGHEHLASGKKVEIMPYVVAPRRTSIVEATHSATTTKSAVDAGLDLKYRVTSNMTLDATVNPDFGQVEVDPAVINLTAFETFFPERRPFFVEGSELFNFGTDGTNSVFYSRRIGRQPSFAPNFAERDVPEVTSILGAVKLTGRTAGGWAMGVLDAVTNEEKARLRTPEGEDGEVVAEPLTNFFAGRLRREGRGGQSSVGTLSEQSTATTSKVPRLIHERRVHGEWTFFTMVESHVDPPVVWSIAPVRGYERR